MGTKNPFYLAGIFALLFKILFSPLEMASQNRMAYELTNKARSYTGNFQFDSAFVYFDSALQAADESGNEALEAYILRLKGRAYIISGPDDSALVYLNKAIHLSEKLKNDTILAMAYLNVAYIIKDRGMPDSALRLYQKALRLYESEQDSIGIAKVNAMLAIHYKYSGDFDRGLNSALIANRIFRKYNQGGALGRSYINLGNIYERLGDYDTAVACYDLAYQTGQKINNAQISQSALINKTVMFWHKGNRETEKGDSLTAQESYRSAKDGFLEAIAFSKKINDWQTLPLLYSNISIVYRDLHRYNEAIASAQEAVRIAKEMDLMTDQLNALNNLGIAYTAVKQYKKAEASYLESLKLAKRSKQKEAIQEASSNLSSVYEMMGKYKEALKYSRMSAAWQDSLFNENKQKLIEEHKTNYEILYLKDRQKITRLKEEKARQERNIIFVVASVIVVILLLLIIFFRMRAKKNRIIAEQRIQKLEDEKKLMAAQAVMVGQEKERERIARELHDGIGVLLSTASIHFSSVEDKTDKETADMLKKANTLLREAGKEVRQISHNMMPGVLSKFGLKEAVEDMFENVEEAGEIEVDLHLDMGDDRLPQNMEIMIFRIVQEMLNNTLKHAKASKITFSLKKEEQDIRLEYEDNGIGFDEEKLSDEKSLGLSGIRSRVEYLGGTVELKTGKGKGTSYSVIIPLHEK